jgi:hypothetical protein
MKKLTNLCRTLVLAGTILLSVSAGSAGILPAFAPERPLQSDTSISLFWKKFRGAIIKSDKAAVAGLSQFPISMPYGMPTIRTRAQLIKRYRDVFNRETNAAHCFATAQPETDPARPKEFTIACKNSAGDEVIIYSFKRTGKGWAFAGLDNINE